MCNHIDAIIAPVRAMYDVHVKYGVNILLEIIPSGVKLLKAMLLGVPVIPMMIMGTRDILEAG